MHSSVYIRDTDDADDKHHMRGSRSKGGFCQRLSVHIQLFAQRIGRKVGIGKDSGASAKNIRAGGAGSSSSCWTPCTIVLFLLLLLFTFLLVLQDTRIDELESQIERASAAVSDPSGMVAANAHAEGGEEVGWIKRVRMLVAAAARTRTGSSLSKQQTLDAPTIEHAAIASTPIPTSSALIPTPTSNPAPSFSSSGGVPLGWAWNTDSYDREKEIYTTLADAEALITPEVVKAFRRGNFEWHNALPTYEHSGNGDLDFSRLVAGEVATTKFLTYDFSLHKYWRWGTDHGPMKEFASCRKLFDKCNVHGRDDCLNNGLCGWCKRVNMCVDRSGKALPYDEHEKRPACNPDELELGPQNTNLRCMGGTITSFENGQLRQKQSTDGCQFYLADRLIDTQINQNAGAMYYHFLKEHFEPWYQSHFVNGAITDRYSQVVVTQGSMDHFGDYYGVFTNICPRYAREVPNGACFCDPSVGEQQRSTSAGPAIIPVAGRLPVTSTLTQAMVVNLGLQDVQPPANRPALGLLSRENKRFILNELELARIAVEMGVSIKLLPLEYMTVYEQIREFRRLHFLTGIHGSGLSNYFLLHTTPEQHQPGLPEGVRDGMPDAEFREVVEKKKHFRNYCLQILPYQVRIGGEGLRSLANQIDCTYEEWVQPKRSNTVLHTHFLNGQDFGNLENLMSTGPAAEDSAFFSFWVNQDTIVDPEDWRMLLRRMVSD